MGVGGDVRGVVLPECASVSEVAAVFDDVVFDPTKGTTNVARVVGVEPAIDEIFEPFVATFAAACFALRAVDERFFECAVEIDAERRDAIVV